MNTKRNTLHGLAISGILAGTAGFPSAALGGNSGFVLDSHDSHYGRLSHVSAQRANGELVVSGEVRKASRGRGHIPGWVSIELIGNDGRVIAAVTSHYKRRSPRATSAWFRAGVAHPDGEVDSVRVSHHPPASWSG